MDSDFIAISDIHFSTRDRRDSEFHRATCSISRACLRSVIQFDGEILRVIRSQDSSGRVGNHRVVRNVLLNDLNDPVAGSI